MTFNTYLRRLGVLAATGLALAAPGAAEAGSIVFIKDADVWLARDDGSGQVRLTTDGTPADPYYSPSQADDGTIVVLRGPDGRPSLSPTPVGSRVYRLNRAGGRLGAPFTALVDPLPSLVPKAIAADVSPDGRVVAVSQRLFEPGFDSGCFCTRLRAIAQNAVFKDAHTGAYLGKSELVGQELWNPSWVGSDRVLLFDQFSAAGPHVYVAGVAARPSPLYRDPGRDPLIPTWNLASLGAGELTRAGDRLAAVRALPSGGPRQGPTTIQVLDANGVSGPPVPRCEIAGRAISLEPGLNWSPDGSTLSWYEATGIWATRVEPNASDCGASPRLLVPGGYDHDWGRAGVPAPDTDAPAGARLTVTGRGTAVAAFRLSEAATVRGQVERLRGRRAAVVRRLAARTLAAGPVRLTLGRLGAGRYRLRLVLTDAAGNTRTIVRVFAR